MGSRGTSRVVQGARFKVGVRLAASSANKDKGLNGRSAALLALLNWGWGALEEEEDDVGWSGFPFSLQINHI